LAFPSIAVLAALLHLSAPAARREFGALSACAALLAAFAYMLVALRGYSYAIWFGLPFVAAAAPEVLRRLRLNNLALRFGVLILLTPTAVTLGTITLASATGLRELTELNSGDRGACTDRAHIGALAALPAGRVAINQIEWSPYILAWTPHSVLAAPYHRLSPAILASHRIFASGAAEARAAAAAGRVDYIAICGSSGVSGVAGPDRAASLWGRLEAGSPPDWLEPVPGTRPYVVYRVRP
jgi:hypothetical protein